MNRKKTLSVPAMISIIAIILVLLFMFAYMTYSSDVRVVKQNCINNGKTYISYSTTLVQNVEYCGDISQLNTLLKGIQEVIHEQKSSN